MGPRQKNTAETLGSRRRRRGAVTCCYEADSVEAAVMAKTCVALEARVLVDQACELASVEVGSWI